MLPRPAEILTLTLTRRATAMVRTNSTVDGGGDSPSGAPLIGAKAFGGRLIGCCTT